MIPKECKRLAEVDFPIAVVSKHSAREKSIRHGHPSTLHLWWARRPLAACRTMLMALLLPDPCDPACPNEFMTAARDILLKKNGRPRRWEPEVSTPEGLRKTLLEFIGDFANWDNSANMDYLSVARALVKAAHSEETPLVVDPFAGGGSIPLEALRLGCEAFASDLNPVACLILKVMLEDIPRNGLDLAKELRRVGAEIKDQAEKELVGLYPKDPDGAIPIAYLWARTVHCESPNCGAEIPIFKSAWLSKKGANKARYFHEDSNGQCVALIVESKPLGGPVKYEIARGQGSEVHKPGYVEINGSKAKGNNANVICPCCGIVLPGNKRNPRTVSQLAAQNGGADVVFDNKGNRIGGAIILAVVTLSKGNQGRNYRLPTEHDYKAVWKAHKRLRRILEEWERDGKKAICPIPDEPLPPIGTLGFRVQRYGMLKWGDLFTARQKVMLTTILALINKNQSAKELLALALDKLADKATSLCRWKATAEYMAGNTFSRQALPIVWDYCEANPFSGTSGGWQEELTWILKVVDKLSETRLKRGQIQQADACESPLPAESAAVFFTDPPYYDAIPYSDLSDFFLVWNKRSLPGHTLLRDPFNPGNVLSPKIREAVQDETKEFDGQPKDKAFFESRMADAFKEGFRILREDGIGSVVFAHKTTEGWEALLSGMTRGGWVITGSWPIATESGSRLRAMDSAALATSVHLVCRPRSQYAYIGDWAEVLRELPNRVGNWMERLQVEGIRGADLVFACIGPALEIFSRYRKVETADGKEVKLAEYLEKVWEVVGRTALEQVLGTAEAQARNSAAGALEEDARLTALFLWTLQSTNGEPSKGEIQAEDEGDEGSMSRNKPKGYSLVFDVARRFAQPLGIDLPKWEGRIIETEKGVVRLMAVSERAKQIFGSAGIESAVEEILSTSQTGQMLLPGFQEEVAIKRKGKRRGRGQKIRVEDPSEMDASATTLDRVHAAMLLQAGGQANALRALIKAEQDRGPDFLRLANALSALYPKDSEEKRLLDAMLLAVPR